MSELNKKIFLAKYGSSDHISDAQEDTDPNVRNAAISNPNATKEHIDKALNDEYYVVRHSAISNPNATKEHIDKALNDNSYFVRKAAIEHPKATKEHIDKALNDEDYAVRIAAIKTPNATKEHIDKALNDEDYAVRIAAIKNPNATKEHIDKALNDEDYLVRSLAQEVLNKKKGKLKMSHFNQVTEASIAYIMMNTSILLEDRLDYLKANTKKLDTSHDTTAEHKETPDIIQHFADKGDPTKNKQHTQYIINLYRDKKIRQDDAPGIHGVLSNFEKYKGKLSPEERQLSTSKYPRISDLQDKIAPHLGTMASKKQAEKTLEQPGHTLVHEDDKIKIYRLEKTKEGKEASKALYGGGSERGSTGTNWCTAARSDDRNYFDNYLKEGGHYHVIHRKSDGAVFQMHPQSNQFHDAKNNDISPEDFKSIAPSLHTAWAKHPEMLD